MEDLHTHFPALSSYVYLNTAANGLVPNSVLDWRRKHDSDLMVHPSGFREGAKAHLDKVKTTIGRFFGASTNEIGLIPNFSLGLNIILDGLPQGQKILLLKNDYPSVTWPVETRDFNVCYAEIDENLENNIEAAIAKHRPDVFIFSIVQWLSGIKIDLEFVKSLKQSQPELLLIADGTQYLGSEFFNFHESGIDVLGTSGYKWLTSGFGNGIIMVKKEAQRHIFPRTIGFNSAENFSSSPGETQFIKHFEPGHLDTLNFGSLEQSLLFIESYGKENLYAKIKMLSDLAKSRFEAMGLLTNSTILRRSHSSIFNLKGNDKMFQKLRSNNIISSPRGGGIRVSFHYYNSTSDLEKLLEVIGA
jgi:selenocysteine lyase/cysteine desulfurase